MGKLILLNITLSKSFKMIENKWKITLLKVFSQL
jgi:hypothetical protein